MKIQRGLAAWMKVVWDDQQDGIAVMLESADGKGTLRPWNILYLSADGCQQGI